MTDPAAVLAEMNDWLSRTDVVLQPDGTTALPLTMPYAARQDVIRYRDAWTEQTARVEALEGEAAYSQHHPGCRTNWPNAEELPQPVCNCGLDNARAKVAALAAKEKT